MFRLLDIQIIGQKIVVSHAKRDRATKANADLQVPTHRLIFQLAKEPNLSQR